MIKTDSNQALDIILQYCIENENVQPHQIKEDLFPNLNDDEIKYLLEQILNHNIEIADVTFGEYNTIINSNGLTQGFLNQGGFTEIRKQELLRLKKQKEQKDIEFRKSKIDLEIAENMLKEYPYTKWFARISFIIALCLTFLELYKYITK